MKFYIYLHTHWDREWYFTNGVSQILFKNNLNFYLQDPTLTKFYLDGQVSLVDDYLKIINPKNQENFLNLLKNKKIITGPLYSQPDLFNSLGETTIRNFELTKKFANDNNLKLSPILYVPDTFGFPINFPQLLNKLNFQEMIFWRGLDYPQQKDHFLWKGINDFKINAYNLKFGYFFLGHFINWAKLTEENLADQAQKFVTDFYNSAEYQHFKSQNKEIILIGSGHDQAAPYKMVEKFFALVDKLAPDQFIIKTHQQYFKDSLQEQLPVYQKALDYATNSKIHRTIASSRYSLKKLFREVEHLLYHQLEPLQLAIKSTNKDFDIYQNILWQKELVKLQAHDALGGCVSDEVYLENLTKLNDLKNQILAQKDYILKIIANQRQLNKDEFLIFNPNVSVANNSIVEQQITLNQKHNLFIDNPDYALYLIYKDKNYLIDKGYLHNLIFVNKKMQCFDLLKINLDQMQSIEKIKQLDLNSWNDFSLIIEDDLGDTYDFDPNLKQNPTIVEKSLAKSWIYHDLTKTEIFFYEPKHHQEFKLTIFKYQNIEKLQIATLNKLKNSRVALQFNAAVDIKNLKYQQLLALLKPEIDDQDNWQTFYKEKPVNNYRTSGLIVTKNNFIQTFGTNEFFILENKLVIVLYRCVDKLGKGNLNYRPGPVSGLASKILFTPFAQYENVNLKFDLQINSNTKLDINDVANNFLRLPIVYHHQSMDVESNKLGQFILDSNNSFNLDFVKPQLSQNYFVSSSWINFDNQYQYTLVDFKTNEMKIIKHEK